MNNLSNESCYSENELKGMGYETHLRKLQLQQQEQSLKHLLQSELKCLNLENEFLKSLISTNNG